MRVTLTGSRPFTAMQQVDTPSTLKRSSPPNHTNRVSIIIPVFNEDRNVDQLIQRIHTGMESSSFFWELIVIDDGSEDDTFIKLEALADSYGEHVHVVSLQRNFGQTAAMQAGIDYARGDIIVTLDGDLQNDPMDIPRMVNHLIDKKLDLLVGWRKQRKDGFWLRKLPSKIANRLIGWVTGVKLHDYGCSLKVYRASIIKQIQLYGEMHRFIPAWVARIVPSSRIGEIEVNHSPRIAGTSKYGISRTFRVLIDLLAVFFFMRYSARPGHFFGSIGLLFGAIGSTMLAYLAVLKYGFGESIGQRPLLMIGILFVVTSVQLLTTGVISELLTRTYYASGNVESYRAGKLINPQADSPTGWHHSK
ncbi:MAG: glycosyltransferase family 2 protein [Gammaproteobacteria bacterium]|nr:glycosyltransferase family 2 protein [Gammaproteobacteria bacterium]